MNVFILGHLLFGPELEAWSSLESALMTTRSAQDFHLETSSKDRSLQIYIYIYMKDVG